MSYFRSFSIAMGASMVMLVLSFLNNKIIYLFLSKSDNGLYFIFLRITMFVSLFFGEWFRLSNINIAGKDKSLIPHLSANTLLYSVSVGLFTASVALIFSCFFDSFAYGMPWKYFFVAVLVGSAAILRDSSQSFLLVLKRMYRYGFTLVIWGSTVVVVNCFFLIMLRRGLDFAVMAWITGIFAGALWAFFSTGQTGKKWKRPSWSIFMKVRAIGGRAWLAIVGMFIMINVHTFLIEPLSGDTARGLAMVAVFSVCFRVFQLLQRVSNVSGMILLSHVVQEEKPKGFKMTMVVARNIILFSFLFCLIVIITGKGVIYLISSSKYLMAYVPLLLLLPGIIAVNAGSVINNMYWGHEYPYKVILAPYVVTVIGVILDIALIPTLGVHGVSLSFTVMGLIWFLYIVMVFRKDSGFRLREILLLPFEDIVQVVSRVRAALPGGKR